MSLCNICGEPESNAECCRNQPCGGCLTLTGERDALRERVQRLEKEAEAGKQLNRDLLSCLEADMREDFDMDEMIEAVERYEKIVFPIAIPEGER